MGLKQELELVGENVKDQRDRLAHNEKLFNIYEGDLLTYVLEDLQAQLHPNAFKQVQHRVAPINVLKRLVDKLSKIYAKPPTRSLSIESDKDKKLWAELTETMDLNTNMTMANEFFNLFKTAFVEPYLDNGTPALRILPAARYAVMSMDTVNPARPTHFTKIMGVDESAGKKRLVLHTYTNEEFWIHDEKGKIFADRMTALKNPRGVNIYGRIPGVYINRSRHELIPQIDSDTLAMTKLLPVILSDLNYAVMYQCFAILVGYNITSENLTRDPSVLWNIKSDGSADHPPRIDVIKPDVDSDKVLALVETQFKMWLQSRGIKPGAMGQLTTENAASGFSKAIDEMDTSEDRQKQVPYFVSAERELADLIINHMQPVWIRERNYTLTKQAFSKGIKVAAQFSEQRPIMDTSKVLADEVVKIEKKLTTRKRALKALNPDATDEEIEQIMTEIDQEQPKATEAADDELEGLEPEGKPEPKEEVIQ